MSKHRIHQVLHFLVWRNYSMFGTQGALVGSKNSTIGSKLNINGCPLTCLKITQALSFSPHYKLYKITEYKRTHTIKLQTQLRRS